MDSVTLSVDVTTQVRLAKANGTLNPTIQSETTSTSQGYGAVGTSANQINVVWYKAFTLAGAGTLDISLDDASVNPVDTAGNVLVTMTMFQVRLVENVDLSANSTGISVKGKTGDGAKLMMLVSEQGFTVPKLGSLTWESDYGLSPKTATTAKTIRFTNLDATNSASVELLITGRST